MRVVVLRCDLPFLLMVHRLDSLVVLVDCDRGTHYHHYCLWLLWRR
jgi:hypothetical protein